MGQTHEQRIAKLTDAELADEMRGWVEGGLFWRTLERTHPEHVRDGHSMAAYAHLAMYAAAYMQRHGDAPPAGWPCRFNAEQRFVP